MNMTEKDIFEAGMIELLKDESFLRFKDNLTKEYEEKQRELKEHFEQNKSDLKHNLDCRLSETPQRYIRERLKKQYEIDLEDLEIYFEEDSEELKREFESDLAFYENSAIDDINTMKEFDAIFDEQEKAIRSLVDEIYGESHETVRDFFHYITSILKNLSPETAEVFEKEEDFILNSFYEITQDTDASDITYDFNPCDIPPEKY